MIERNLERLKSEEQAVLEATSVAGAEFSAAAVAAALERPQKRSRRAACAYHGMSSSSLKECDCVARRHRRSRLRLHATMYQEVLYRLAPVWASHRTSSAYRHP